ncbi:hypothetical protein SISSUDRAFT_1066162 [Sistotremastrum suecicum HHB10207 ss-3]|uniref:Uncharacterized protein n=1 Tax=Sistotremastrum suecicum HHB10207 ss-3 TaxID=1314776 RepID=A0A165YMK2_9AGAM|nr:hypothetical protein SISSUDRAFT_1066162 [Sistotremastrum suecicum HHB10207 ss-3]
MQEVRKMENYFIACMDSELPTHILTALRALMDFRYRTQADDISEPEATRITESLAEFHRLKAIINNPEHKYREVQGWSIPKLERMHPIIPKNAHIEVVKVPYRLSNRRNNHSELFRILDRMEKRLQYLIMVSIQEEYRMPPPSTMDLTDDSNESLTPKVSVEETVGRKFLGTSRKITNYFVNNFEQALRLKGENPYLGLRDRVSNCPSLSAPLPRFSISPMPRAYPASPSEKRQISSPFLIFAPR